MGTRQDWTVWKDIERARGTRLDWSVWRDSESAMGTRLDCILFLSATEMDGNSLTWVVYDCVFHTQINLLNTLYNGSVLKSKALN